jgi:hypothetical protein
MPFLETVEELVESLADSLGIYSQRLKFLPDPAEGHADDCGCRACWCGRMEERCREAVRNEHYLATMRQATEEDYSA